MGFSMQFALVSCAVFSAVIASPKQYSTAALPYSQYSSSHLQYQSYPSQYTTPIPIVSYKQEQNIDGTYAYSYQTANGIAAEERGALKNQGTPNEANSAEGYFAYSGPDGVQYSISYVADDEGFRPQGAHLPTPPPLPEAIQKAWQNLPLDDNEYDERGFPINKQQNYSPVPARPSPSYAPSPSFAPKPSLGTPVQGYGGRA